MRDSKRRGDGLSTHPDELRQHDDEIGREQEYVSMLYGRLDGMREQAARRLTDELRAGGGGTQQDRSQRDSAVQMYADQVEQFSAVEQGLAFGRLDGADGSRHYIGRIGIFDTGGDYDPLLMDWRAPAARPFYLATAANPQGIRMRRHLRTRERKVTGLNDEVLDIETASPTGHEDLTGEASLLAALSAGRTGRMRDIVETIQAEQDRIIRADLPGVLVVQGGPGTGKTAVALHRAAYLLYTHRQQLSTRGVLLVGPNATFLRYISQVLPALAETGVLLSTPGDLFPGVSARRAEPARTAALKGRAVLAEVLAAAVRDRQWVPDEPIEIELPQREVLRLDPETVREARDRVRRTERPHNLARALFDIEIVHALAEQVAERIGADPLGGENLLEEADRAEIRRELREEPEITAVLDELWPVLTPQRLLADLYAAPERIAAAAPMLTDDERALLHRPAGGGWTPADVPLLDEAAELLGEDERAAAARRERVRSFQREYAEGVLEIARGSRSIDVEDEAEGGEILGVTDLIDADRLLERQEETDRLTIAQRAAADRRWAFGHVIVDEAQELTPMAWRLLMRRCPSRSMTIVGDVAQTGALAGTPSWAEALEPYVARRWRLEELTVSYRTPAEIMAVAAEVLAGIDPALRPPRSVRHSGVPPWDRTVAADRLDAELVAAARAEAADLAGGEVDGRPGDGGGRLGVIVPAGRADGLAGVLLAALPEAAVGEQPELESRVVLLTVGQAKGLEFDSVLVVDPDGIVAESPRGRSDLYVALTRATRRLGVLRPAG
ncbi:HelD family protein [Micromonospora wenchangensis]|uniref:HelD family protein n=1 Tax=Micromonospora wenchangensis TaxID=1185415 RepID=UPI0038290B40